MLTEPAKSTDTKRADEWFTPARFAGILLLLILASFPEVVTGRGTFFHRDFAVFGYPLAEYHRQCFWRGELPFWNPLNNCGLPFLAQWNTLTFYPLSLIYLLLPLSYGLGLFCLTHLFLAGMGMYFLVRAWSQNQFAACLSGIAFAFSALMLNFLMWPNNMAGIGWMPWLVWAVDRALNEGRGRIPAAIVVGTLQMLSGAPEVILLTWLFLGALLLFRFWCDRKAIWKEILRFLPIPIFVAGIAAIQLLPFLELLANSHRDKNFSDADWAMPVWGWASFLVPLFKAIPLELGVFFQPNQYWVMSYYLGIGAISFALLAPLSARGPRVRFMSLLMLFCLVLALGNSGMLYPLVRAIVPGLGFIRYPIKFVMLPAFLVPVLAGLFISDFLESTRCNPSFHRKRIVIFGGVLLVLALTLGVLGFLYPAPGVSPGIVPGNSAVRAVFLALFVGGLLLLPLLNVFKSALLLRIALGLLLWLDVMLMGGIRPNPVVLRSAYEFGLIRKESKMQLLPVTGEGRVMIRPDALTGTRFVQFNTPLETVLYVRLALFDNANLLDDLPKIDGFYSLYLREMETVSRLLSAEGTSDGLLDFLSVSQMNVPGKATEWAPRATQLPWVSSGQRPIFASGDDTLRGLAATNFNPREVVYLPLELQGRVSATNGGVARILTRNFSAHEVRIQVESLDDALLVFQAYYKPWVVFVDGKESVLLRANHAFQALEVPPGRHEVVIIYRDRAFLLGAVISALSLGVLGILWFRCRVRQASPAPTI